MMKKFVNHTLKHGMNMKRNLTLLNNMRREYVYILISIVVLFDFGNKIEHTIEAN